MKRVVTADQDMLPGDRLLVRGFRARLAGDDMANATAGELPRWCWEKVYRAGASVPVIMDTALGKRDLHAIAAGPIMDPTNLYLPAGKLSMDEFRARQHRLLSGEPA